MVGVQKKVGGTPLFGVARTYIYTSSQLKYIFYKIFKGNELTTMQILCDEEKTLLNQLRINYDCALVLFNKYTENWCLLARNKNEVVCSLGSHMLTLDRNSIHILDEICISTQS